MIRRLLMAFAAAFAWTVMAAPGWAAGAPMVIAVFDFDNATLMDRPASEYLARLLPEMLMAGLSRSDGVRLVERVHLRQVLEEQRLGSSDLADPDTQLRLGNITGARHMVFGGYMVLGDQIRVDVRLVETESSLTLFAEPVTGPVSGIQDHMLAMAQRMIDKLGLEGGRSSLVGVSDAVWKTYDEGIALMDAKQYEAAVTVFQSLLAEHPDFDPAARQIQLALEQLARQ